MTWLFNADTDSYLQNNTGNYKLESNKENQEFEYLLFWLGIDKIYSNKKYSRDYLDYVSSFSKVDHSTTTDSEPKGWCCEYSDNTEFLNSKLTSARFAIKNNLCHYSTKIVKEVESFKDGYIYKMPHGSSGRGFVKNESSKKYSGEMIEEKNLDRVEDISTLFLSPNRFIIYENTVDKFFQYKGTSISSKFFVDNYEQKILKIHDFYCSLGIDYPFSIDSFRYRENNSLHMYYLSEVNARKSFGYISYLLKQKYFPNCDNFFLRVSKEISPDLGMLLSPRNNYFKVYMSDK